MKTVFTLGVKGFHELLHFSRLKILFDGLKDIQNGVYIFLCLLCIYTYFDTDKVKLN